MKGQQMDWMPSMTGITASSSFPPPGPVLLLLCSACAALLHTASRAGGRNGCTRNVPSRNPILGNRARYSER